MDIGTSVAVRFLRDYQGFGSRGHLLAVESLSESIRSTRDDDARKLLAVKVFAELMAALENLGALCIAVRHRDDSVGLVYSFLTYESREKMAPPTKVREMYDLVRGGDGLTRGLKLPSLADIIAAHEKFAESTLPKLYSEANILLSQAANVYLVDERSLVRAYNKTKHGFVVVNDHHLFQPDPPAVDPSTAWIAAKNPSYDPQSPELTPVVELYSVKLDDVHLTVERLPSIRGAIRVIAELTAELLDLGVITCADSRA